MTAQSGEGLIDYDDAADIGLHLVSTADRVKFMHAITPGAQGVFAMDVDGVAFRVVVTVKTMEKAQ